MRQINLKSTTLEKQEFINKYEGLKIEDKGYITNIYKIPESYFNDEAYSVTIQAATTTINNLNDWFLCGFSKEWEKKLTTMDLSKKVFFEGIISTGPVFLGKIGLKNCILK